METLIVIAILGTLAASTLFMSMDSYRGFLGRSEHEVIVSLLQKARSRSMNTIHGTHWGLCVDSAAARYVLFRGSYMSGHATLEATPQSTPRVVTSQPNFFACSSGGVVFSYLSGTTSPTTIAVASEGASREIVINYEGTILW